MILSRKTKKDIEIQKYKEQLQNHIQLEEELLELFQNEVIEIEKLSKVLLKILSKIETTETETKTTETKETTESIKNMENRQFVKEKVLDEQLLIAYNKLSNHLENIADKQHFNIFKLSGFLNLFEKHLLKTEEKNYNIENGKIVVLTKEEEILPIIFKNGKKTLLSVTDFNLSEFKHDELVEILRLLDVTIYDNRYDLLRKQIVDKITSISSISLR